jgi:hypothetical protein
MITPVIFAFISAQFIWLTFLTYLIVKQNTFFKSFTEGISKNDLKTILQNIAGAMKKVSEEMNRQDGEIKSLDNLGRSHLQKIGFVRYNPFADTGGDQSFCLCLLDAQNNGFVLSSLHSREQTRIYAKAIGKGQAKGYELSKEETQAVDLATKRKVGAK